MRESTIEAHLVKRVKALGGDIRKVQWIGHRGAPDRLVMFPWGCSWVELKKFGLTADPHQAREHARLRKFGQIVLVLDSIEAIDEWLKQYA